MTPSGRFAEAIAAIDRANAEDPERLSLDGGDPRPKELVHSELVTDWVHRLDPDATEEQLLAARAHHFRRWTSPRSAHPEGRAGYLRWRTEAGRRHAEEVAGLLRDHGYDERSIERVGRIIRKEGRRTDPRVQTHEDALCLVFVQLQLADVAERLGEEAAVAVVARTLDKMSDRAVELATELARDDRARRVLELAARRSIAPDGSRSE